MVAGVTAGVTAGVQPQINLLLSSIGKRLITAFFVVIIRDTMINAHFARQNNITLLFKCFKILNLCIYLP
jgi:hypothetical protein